MASEEIAVLTESFQTQYGDSKGTRIFRAPGRVNLIGEHTDYNLGFVCPIAMEFACYTAAAPSRDGMFRVYSRNVDARFEWPVEDIPHLQPTDDWTDYVIGIAQQVHRLGQELQALNLAIYSTVPVGSGLSSSAAIEVSTALALLFGRRIDPTELAKLAQRAEREFVGVPCGIMDQYVSVFGESGKALKIDCRTIAHETAPLPDNVEIIAVNSMVKHDLGASEYPVRVRECQEAVAAIKKAYPGVNSLRDVPSNLLDSVKDSMSDTVFRRATHVITENERVTAFAAAAAEGDLQHMGRLFLASHRSLQHDYEVSAEELDFLVDTAAEFTGVYGSRMTGGGFGGCTVNLVAPERVEAFSINITEAYKRRYKLEPHIYRCVPAGGAAEIEQ